jgi:hypothetical protein
MSDRRIRGIHHAAGRPAQREDEGTLRILACAPRRSPGEMSDVERIKRAAGEVPDRSAPLMKAMSIGATLTRLEELLKAQDVRARLRSAPTRPAPPCAVLGPARSRVSSYPRRGLLLRLHRLGFGDRGHRNPRWRSGMRATAWRPPSVPACPTDAGRSHRSCRGPAWPWPREASEWTERFLACLQRDLDRNGGRP